MPLTDDDKDVKKRAVDNIMKLIHSQLALEKKQAKMDAKVSYSHALANTHHIAHDLPSHSRSNGPVTPCATFSITFQEKFDVSAGQRDWQSSYAHGRPRRHN